MYPVSYFKNSHRPIQQIVNRIVLEFTKLLKIQTIHNWPNWNKPQKRQSLDSEIVRNLTKSLTGTNSNNSKTSLSQIWSKRLFSSVMKANVVLPIVRKTKNE